MKYPPLIYAEALRSVLTETSVTRQGTVIEKFVAVLAKNGDLAQGGKIAEKLEGMFVAAAGGRLVKIETARDLPAAQLTKLKGQFGKMDQIQVVINPELVAGVRITIDGERELDQSLARKLRNIFN